MSPTKRPSTITGLRKAVAAPVPPVDGGTELAPQAGPERRPRPAKPIRFTLDLDRDRHSYLKETAAAIEASASEIIRELLDEMRADPDLRARVRARIWAG